MDNKIQNKDMMDWGMHINREKNIGYPPIPQWVKAGNLMEWKDQGVIIWSASAGRVMCLFPHQALDVLDDLRESSSWKETPFCLYWTSYSMPFSEEDRVQRRTTENRRSHSTNSQTNYSSLTLPPEQTQDLLLFLEQHHSTIRELADMRTKEVRKILGRAYTMILGWKRGGRER